MACNTDLTQSPLIETEEQTGKKSHDYLIVLYLKMNGLNLKKRRKRRKGGREKEH